jgi:fibro-slime domain-containing protein/uncharacterized repeat protein (TIGR01451 family)
MSKAKMISGIAALALTVTAGFAAIASPPPRPASFFGTISTDGFEIPGGTRVTAWAGSRLLAEAPVFPADGHTAYSIDVPGDIPETPALEGAVAGQAITLKIGGAAAPQPAAWEAGTYNRLDLTVPAGPDITVNINDGLASVFPGGDLTYTLTVRNNGPQTAVGIVLQDLLPAHATATSLGGGTVADGIVSWPPFDLEAGASTTRTMTLEVATELPVGTTSITNQARASHDGASGLDPKPLDNLGSDTNAVLVPPDFALSAEELTVSPAQPQAGELVTVQLTVRNPGFRDGTALVAVYAGAPFATPPVASQAVTLQAQGAATRTFQFTASGPLTLVSAAADPANQVVELDESNNVARRFLVEVPDLAIGLDNILATPASPRAGDAVEVKVTVRNAGRKLAENVDVTLYDGEPDLGGIPVGTGRIASLPAGGNRALSFNWTAAEGQRRLTAVADPANAFLEMSEENNSAVREIVVPRAAGPDLTVQSVDVAGLLQSATTLVGDGAVSAVLKNVGDATAASEFAVRLFEDRDGDGLFSRGDRELARQTVSAGLAAGATATVQLSLRAHLEFYHPLLWVEADAADAIVELREDNNRSACFGVCEPTVAASLKPVTEEWYLPGMEVETAPVVVQLSDDNGDGRIDSRDIPEIVFHMEDGVGRAVTARSGVDGREVWTYRSPELVSRFGHLAAADLDGDGVAEILAGLSSRKLLALDHSGLPLWTSDPVPLITPDWAGAPSIADLTGDGVPEIVIGHTVLSNTGKLLATGTANVGRNYNWYGPLGVPTTYGVDAQLSVVADIDLDGRAEIVAGDAVYRMEGGQLRLVWDNVVPDNLMRDGFSAVANLDGDPEAEIIYTSSGFAMILNHDKSVAVGYRRIYPLSPFPELNTFWGGPPTVANLDGQGPPEILFAGDRELRAFRSDLRTLYWSRPIDERGSQTAATVFDLDGDGKPEVLYLDQSNFYILNGQNGEVLYSRPNTSKTAVEYPVVADVDNDGQAEILVPSNRSFIGDVSTQGLHVLGNPAWRGTRPIWNQHSYHVTNVLLDGTVPAAETPSWQAANTYRVNEEQPRRTPLLPNPTVGAPRVGEVTSSGAPVTLRIGNGGRGVLPGGVAVVLRAGHGGGGAVVTRGETSRALRPGEWEDVTISWQQAGLAGAPATAEVDPEDAVRECDETDNTVQLEITESVLPDLTIPQDGLVLPSSATSRVAGQPLTIGVRVTNAGKAVSAVSLVRLYDGPPSLGAEGGEAEIPTLAPGQSATIPVIWDSLGRLGTVVLHAVADADDVVLESEEGNNEASGEIALTAPSGPDLSLETLLIEPPSTTVGSPVRLRAEVVNRGLTLPGSFQVVFRVNRVEVARITADGPFEAAGRRTFEHVLDTVDLRGLQQVEAEADPGRQIAEVSEQNNLRSGVLEVASSGLTVSIQTERVSYTSNDTAVLTVRAENGAGAPRDLTLRIFIRSAAGTVQVPIADEAVSLVPGATTLIRSWPTGASAAGTWSAVAELVQADGTVVARGSSLFSIVGDRNVTAQLLVERASYEPGETVALAGRIRNAGSNQALSDLQARLTVTGPSGAAVFSAVQSIGRLEAGQETSFDASWPIANAAPGIYTARLEVREGAGSGSLLAFSGSDLTVVDSSQTGAGLSGEMTVSPDPVGSGGLLLSAFATANGGNADMAGLRLRVRLVRLSDETVAAARELPWPLARNQRRSGSLGFATTGLAEGEYVALLEGLLPGGDRVLARVPFLVVRGVSIGDVTVTEGNAGTAEAVFEIVLSAAAEEPVTVAWATVDGTALAGEDYDAAGGTATFAPGELRRTVAVTVRGDLAPEAAETFLLNLSQVSGAVLGDGQGLADIVDEEGCASPNLLENGGAESGETEAELPGWSLAPGSSGTWRRRFADPVPLAGLAAFGPAGSTGIGGTGGSETELRQDIDLSPFAAQIDGAGQEMLFEAFVQSLPAGQPDGAILTVEYRDAANTTVLGSFDSGEVVSLGAWRAVVETRTVPAGTRWARVRLRGLQRGAAGVFFDRLALRSLGTPTLTGGDAEVVEGNTGTVAARFELRLACVRPDPVELSWTAVSGTAVAGQDFEAASGTVTFAPEQTVATIEVPVRGDSVDEIEETFAVDLSASPDLVLLRSRLTGRITDDDGVVTITAEDGYADEVDGGFGEARVTVRLSQPSGKTVKVSWSTVSGGTAAVLSDFTAASGTLTFAPGLEEQTFLVPVRGDRVDEEDETFLVRLSAPVEATLARADATVTILDNDQAGLRIVDAAVLEGNSGTASLVFPAILSIPADREVRATWRTVDATAVAGTDYEAATGTLTFAPGVTTGSITVRALGNTAEQGDRMLRVVLEAPEVAILADPEAEGTIRDDDGILVSIDSLTVLEGDAAQKNVSLTVRASNVGSRSVTVGYATVAGTASEGSDFLAVSGTLDLSAGSATVVVPLIGDLTEEAFLESFEVRLAQPNTGSLKTGVATVAVQDDDGWVLNQRARYDTTFAGCILLNNEINNLGTAWRKQRIDLSRSFDQTFDLHLGADDGGADGIAYVLQNRSTSAVGAGGGYLAFEGITPSIAVEVDAYHNPEWDGPVDQDHIAIDLQGNVRHQGHPAVPALSSKANVEDGRRHQLRLIWNGTSRTLDVHFDGEERLIYQRDLIADIFSGTASVIEGFTSASGFVTNLQYVCPTVQCSESGEKLVSIGDARVQGVSAGTVSMVFPLTLSCPSDVAVTVDLRTEDGTARAGSDFAPLNGSITFQPGETSKDVTVQILGDTTAEVDEDFRVVLTRADNATLRYAAGVGTILSDEPLLTVASTDLVEPAVNGDVTVTFELAWPLSSTLSFEWATQGGTATSGVDFASRQGRVTFAPGETRQTVVLHLVNDSLREGDETFRLALTNATRPLPASIEFKLIDDDCTENMLRNGSAEEPLAGGKIPGWTTVTGQWTVFNGAPQNGAYIFYAGPVATAELYQDADVSGYAAAIDAGSQRFFFEGWVRTYAAEPVSDTSRIRIDFLSAGSAVLGSFDTGNLISRDTWTRVAQLLTSPAGTRKIRVRLLSTRGTGPNNDGYYDNLSLISVGVPTFTVDDPAAAEGATGTGKLPFTVALRCPIQGPARVDYVTTDGTAQAGSDYQPAFGTLIFQPGETSKKIEVSVLDDTIRETDETLFLNLANPAGAAIARVRGTGTIREDEPRLSIADKGALEGQSGRKTVTLQVTLSAAGTLPVRVGYSTADGTATAGRDYVAKTGTLEIAGGLTGTIEVEVIGDTEGEADETFFVRLSDPRFATIDDGEAVVTITDDDLTISIGDATVLEGNSGTVQAVFPLTLSRPSLEPVSVRWRTEDRTATQPADYTAASNQLVTIPAGKTTATIAVSVKGDTASEVGEHFAVLLSEPINAGIADGEGLGTIADDDDCPSRNLLRNPGAEEPLAGTEIPGWQEVLGTVWTRSTAQKLEGSVSFTPGVVADAELVQDVDVSAFAARIDAEIQIFSFDGFLRTADETTSDTGRIRMEFLDAARAVLAVQDSGLLTSPSGWRQIGTLQAAPAGTRWVRIRLIAARGPANTTNDVYFDQLALRSLGVPLLEIGDRTLTEGNAGTTETTVGVTLSCPQTEPVTVRWATADGMALQGIDYERREGTLTFEPGVTTASIALSVFGDVKPEGDETFFVDLADSSGPLLLRGRGQITMRDNDRPATLTLTGTARDFRPSTHPDFEKFFGTFYPDAGIVEFLLGPDRKPVYGNHVKTPTTTGGTWFDQWYRDVEGVNLATQIPIQLESKDPARPTVYSFSDDDFFPIDGQLYGNEGRAHNFHFTYEVHTQFLYQGGEVFTFTGDDDLWAFINGRLAIDLGGVHYQLSRTVNLDEKAAELGLVPGQVYDIDLFFAERRSGGSSLRIETTLLLGSADPGVIQLGAPTYEVTEDGTVATVTVTRTRGVDGQVSVSYATADDTAREPADYTATSGTITFRDGDAEPRTITIPLTDDETIEPAEAFRIVLGQPTGQAELGPLSAAVVNIRDEDGRAALSATKADALAVDVAGDGQASPGDRLRYVIRVENTGNIPAENVIVTDPIPAHTTLVADSVILTQGSVTGTTPLTVALGALAPGAVATVTFDAAVAETLPVEITAISNQGSVTAAGLAAVPTDDPETLDVAGDSTVTPVANKPELKVTKEASVPGSSQPAPGDTIHYVIGIANEGGSRATNVALEDLVPPYTTLVADSVETTQGSTDGSDPARVRVALGEIAAGSSAEVSFDVRIASSVPATLTKISNQGVVSSQELPVVLSDDPNLGGTADPTDVAITAEPELIAEKIATRVADPDKDNKTSPGDTIEYLITVRNRGNAAATEVTFSDQIPAHATPVDGSVIVSQGTGGAVAGEVRAELGDIAGQQEATVRFRVVIANPFPAGIREISNQGTVAAAGLASVRTDDPGVGGPSDPTITVVAAAPKLEVDKKATLTGSTVSPGDTFLYVITITNRGNTAATNVVLADDLPAGLTLVPGTLQTSQGSVTTEEPLRLALGQIAANATATVSFQVSVDAAFTGTEVTSQATLNADGIDPVPSNDPETEAPGDPTSTPVFITPDITIENLTIVEGAGTAGVQVRLSKAGNREVRVDFATADGTAVTGADYTSVTGTLTFAPGETVRTISVPVLDDLLDESDETLTIALSNEAGGNLISGSATVTIEDNDAAPAFAVADTQVAEGGAVELTVSLSAPSGLPVQIGYVTADGTATSADYAAASGILIIPAGSTTATFSVQTTTDELYEPDEKLFVNLIDPVNATPVDAQAEVTITNDDGAPPLSITDVTVTEGDSGSATATLTVSLSAVSGLDASARYSTVNATATAGADYTAATELITIPAGSTSTTITVDVLGDRIDEQTESFRVVLSEPSAATLADAEGEVTITDDDETRISIDDVRVTEGQNGTTDAVFTVKLSVPSDRQVRVASATAAGTATEGEDYDAASDTLVFAAGEVEKTVTVRVIGDGLLESEEETFTVELSNAENAVIEDGTGAGVIADDETCAANLLVNPTVDATQPGWTAAAGELWQEVDVTAFAAQIDAGQQKFSVLVQAAAGAEVIVEYRDASGSVLAADAGEVRTAPAGTRHIWVRLMAAEAAEVFESVALQPVRTPVLRIGDFTVTEAGEATLSVALSCLVDREVTVSFATVDGIALAPADYEETSGTLVFAPGETEKTVTVATASDALDEPEEAFEVVLSNATEAVAFDARATVQVIDDDEAPSYSIADVQVTEGGAVELTVSLSAPSGQQIELGYTTADGTALAGSDYTATSGTLTIPAGSTAVSFPLQTTTDALFETNEKLFVNLINPVNATPADAQAEVTITEDDPTPTLSITDVTVTEKTGEPVTAELTVLLSVPSGRAATVSYTTVEGTARAGSDYTADSETITIPAGATIATIAIEVLGDEVDELDESFQVVLSNPVAATLADAEGTIQIRDNDEARLTVADVEVTEGDEGVTEAVFTVRLTTPSDREVRVTYATEDGTATEGPDSQPDYEGVSDPLVFATGDVSKTVTVRVNGDVLFEENETFDLVLADASGAAVQDGRATGTILDDEECPTPNLLANPGAEEGSTQAGVIPGWTAAGVAWTRRSGNPAPAQGTAYFAAGGGGRTELFQDVDVSAYADRVDSGLQRFQFEGMVRTLNEVPSDTVTLVVEYRDAAGALDVFDSGQIASPLGWSPVSEERLVPAGTRSIRVRLIADLFGGTTNDAWVDGLSLTALRAPSIYISDERVYESPAGTINAVFDVTLSCELDRPSSVLYSTADGTAVAGEDYLTVGGALTFPAGSTRQTITVPVLGDDIHERHETFVVDLVGPEPQGLVSLLDPQGEGTIVNDDFCARSPGFWKTHDEVWPVRSLVMGGRLYSEAEMAALLGYNGPDASNHLARQLVATRLNLEVGSSPAILPDVQAANTFLASFPPSSNPKGANKDRANAIKNKLDAYNNSGCEQVPVIP